MTNDSKTVMSLTEEEVKAEYAKILEKRNKKWNTIENDLLNKHIDELTDSEYEHAIDIRYRQLKEGNFDKIRTLKGDLQDKLVKDVFPGMSLDELITERDAFLERWANSLMDARIEDILLPSYILLFDYWIKKKQEEVNK
jgi:hypothetical protein